MSTHLFCPSCGSQNQYINGNKPNFCVGCGHNFKSLAVFGGNAPQPARPSRPTSSRTSSVMDLDFENEDDAEQEIHEEAGISKADIVIDAPISNRMRVGDVLDTAKMGYDEARHDLSRKVARRNTKQAFATFQDEAGKGGAKRTEIG